MSIMIMDFNALTFDMYDTTGARIGGSDDVNGSMTIDTVTGAGTATVASDQLIFGYLWTAHDVTVQMSADGSTASFNMLFDWNTSLDIPVSLDTAITYNADGTMSFAALDTDGDGILGSPMTEGPFVGFTVAFSGEVYPEGTAPAYVAPNSQPVVSDVIAVGTNTIVVGFDDLNSNVTQGTPIDGYNGIDWADHVYVLNGLDYNNQQGGYDEAVTSGDSVAYNGGGASPTTLTFNEVATFNSMQLTSAWDSTQSVTFTAFLDGQLVYTSNTITINNITPTLIELNYEGIDQLVITSTGSQWAMDDFTYTIGSETATPEASDSEITTFTDSLATATDLDTTPVADTHTYTLVANSTAADNAKVTVTDANITVTTDGDYTLTGNFEALALYH